MIQDKLAAARPNAWLLDFGSSLQAAVGSRVLLQIIESPKLHTIPCTPPHCHDVLSWQGKLFPVMDLAAFLGSSPQAPRLVAIVGYTNQPGTPAHFGALILSAPPVAILVNDDQACPLTALQEVWRDFSASCFNHQGTAFPVLHLGHIFSASPSP